MKMLRNLIVAVVMIAIATPAFALFQPNVNLGFTSFLDGGPPAGPGHYISEYLQFYSADKLVVGGTDVKADVDVTILMNQYIYQSNQELFGGGKWGLNVMLPIVDFDTNLPDNGSGLGDLLVGPYLQWDPIMGEKGPLMLNRVEFQLVLPTGDYDNAKALNQGSNHFSFNPYWAATVFLGPKATVSWRLHYLWNDENDDPFVALPANKVEPGQAIHGNFAFAYEIMPKQLRLGINGYFFEQISDTKSDLVGNLSDDEKVFAVGPGLVYHFSQDSHLFFNAYYESNADNRPEGERYNLRIVHHF
jgi:anthranilate 1,2-dioxygenase (deaminating, decarboxylating) large subunit